MRIHLASSFMLIVSAALLSGCPGDENITGASASGSTGEGTGTSEPTTSTTGTPGTTTTTDATTDTPTGGMSDSGTTTTGPDTTTTTGPDTTTTTGPDTTTTGVDTTGEPGSTGVDTTGGGDLCAPDPGDDECAMCMKSQCCDELNACLADEKCSCVTDCVQGGGNPFQCLPQCMADFNDPILGGFAQCAMGPCGDVCQ